MGVREGIPVYINGLLEVLSGIMGVTEGTSGFRDGLLGCLRCFVVVYRVNYQSRP